MVRASRRAQSTVDGFYAIHTKLTDSVECSPRHAETAKGAWVGGGDLRRRADKRENIGGGMSMEDGEAGVARAERVHRPRDASGEDTRGYFSPRLEHKLGGVCFGAFTTTTTTTTSLIRRAPDSFILR